MYQLDDEKKKAEEQRQAHDSMLKSLQSSNRESVIGREEAQSRFNDMEHKFLSERKLQEEQYNEYRKRLTNELEQLKKKNNELELSQKVQEGEYEKNTNIIKEQLIETEQARDHALKQLRQLESTKGNAITSIEERYKQREKELEQQLEEKEHEIEESIHDNTLKSESKLNELKKLHDEEKERLEKRVEEQKLRLEKKLNSTIQEYEDKVTELTNNHEDAYNALEDEKAAMESDLNNILNQLEKESQMMQQQIDNKDRQLAELKDSYSNLQNQSSRTNDL
mmetsp:Transcript_9207/g.13957  ORF Transcript_9207/g.13957 Transcript_9207/m.13957 type:complete len:280 (+) Transcript_9207:2384-3223(+)